MRDFLAGALLSLVANMLTVLGWYYIGMWLPSLLNVGLALLILGFWGLEDQWAFPGGYWTVQLLAIVLWISGVGFVGGLTLP